MVRSHKIVTQQSTSVLSEQLQQALASLALEGIILPPESLMDIAKLDSGAMSKEEFLAKTIAKSKS